MTWSCPRTDCDGLAGEHLKGFHFFCEEENCFCPHKALIIVGDVLGGEPTYVEMNDWSSAQKKEGFMEQTDGYVMPTHILPNNEPPVKEKELVGTGTNNETTTFHRDPCEKHGPGKCIPAPVPYDDTQVPGGGY